MLSSILSSMNFSIVLPRADRAPAAKRNQFLAACAIPVLAGLAMLAAARPAEAADLSGSWRGGGSVSFLSGKAERARCKASYAKSGATTYSMSATCATPSGSVSQSAIIRKVGGNSYRGSFYNAEWDASGSISITVSGRSQSVSVSSTKGSANMRLSR